MLRSAQHRQHVGVALMNRRTALKITLHFDLRQLNRIHIYFSFYHLEKKKLGHEAGLKVNRIILHTELDVKVMYPRESIQQTMQFRREFRAAEKGCGNLLSKDYRGKKNKDNRENLRTGQS